MTLTKFASAISAEFSALTRELFPDVDCSGIDASGSGGEASGSGIDASGIDASGSGKEHAGSDFDGFGTISERKSGNCHCL